MTAIPRGRRTFIGAIAATAIAAVVMFMVAQASVSTPAEIAGVTDRRDRVSPAPGTTPVDANVLGTAQGVVGGGDVVTGAATGWSMEQAEARYAGLAAGLATSPGLQTFEGPLANWPITGRITSPFGPRWGGYHNGLDIAAPMNTPIRAAAAGQVVTVGKPYLAFGDTATLVIIAHGRGFATVYVHLSDGRPPIVRPGQRVAAGEVIAYNGSTGWSTGPHVHFMTVVSARSVDPLEYLPAR